MNKYGQQAMTAWRENLPEEYSQIEDPESHFEALGEQIQEKVLQTEDSLLANESLSEDYLTNVGQRNMTRLRAEELVMHDLVWSRMPATPEDEDEPGTEDPSHPMGADGMPKDRSHPLWAMFESDEVSPEEYAKAARAWHREVAEQGYPL